ncbi:MAG: hypothetical protein WCH34_02985 [Bacteroidota bacterium]
MFLIHHVTKNNLNSIFTAMFRKAFWILFLMVFAYSCHKDGDMSSPVVEVYSPANYSSYSVLDTIMLNIRVTDNIKVEWVKVSVVNTNHIAALHENSYQSNTAEFNLNAPYIIDDIYLNSGTYYICVMASDGRNQTTFYRQIYITGIPRKLIGIIAITKNQTLSNVIKVDTFLVQHNVSVSTPDIAFSALNSRNQILFMSGKYSLPLIAFNLNTLQTDWSVLNQATPPFPYFENLNFATNSVLYVSFTNGNLRGYTSSGSVVFSPTTETNWIPSSTCLSNLFLLCDKKNLSGQQHQLSVYFSLTSYLLQQLSLNDFATLEIVPKNSSSVYLIGNQNNLGTIKLYSITDNSIANITTGSTQAFTTVKQLNSGQILIANPTDVSLFDMNTENMSALISGLSTTQIQVEDISNRIYVAHQNSIKVYSLSPLTFQNEITFADTIARFHLLYNK